MKKTTWMGLIIIVLVIVIVGFTRNNSSQYDTFAQCLTEKGTTMYGAYWCGHCQNKKELFGGSWKYMNYVECSLPGGNGQTEICKQAGIEGYPTWEFADGTRKSGELQLEQLSILAGCPLQ